MGTTQPVADMPMDPARPAPDSAAGQNERLLALADEAQWRRILIDNSRDGIVVIDQDHRIADANFRFAEMLGCSVAEVIGLHTWDYEANLSEAQIRAAFSDFAQVDATFETRHRRRDGRLLDVEVSASGVRLGGRQAVFAVCRDITERKLAEERLRASEAALNEAQAVAHLGSWTLDITTGQLSWTAETYRVFGVVPGTSLTLQVFLNCIHAEDRDRVAAAWQAAVEQAASYDIEHRIVAFGETRWVRERAQIRRDSRGQAVYAIGTVQDITERHLTEAALRRREAHHRSVLDALGEGVYGVDDRGNCTFINAAALAMLGFAEQEILGQAQHELFHHHRRDGTPYPYRECPVHLTVRDGQPRRCIEWFLRKDGSGIPVEIVVSPLPVAAGDAAGAVVAALKQLLPHNSQRLMGIRFYFHCVFQFVRRAADLIYLRF